MRTLGRLVLVVLVLGVLLGITFYLRPLWVMQQGTHFGLFLSRVQSNYVLTPEGRVHYYEAEPRIPGGGIPIVLVHGLGDRDEAWAPMLRRLKRAGFHVYAPDLLGYGRSPRPENGDYSINGQTKFVYDFIQALGLQKTDLGGWSMGGWIALKLALDHPEQRKLDQQPRHEEPVRLGRSAGPRPARQRSRREPGQQRAEQCEVEDRLQHADDEEHGHPQDKPLLAAVHEQRVADE